MSTRSILTIINQGSPTHKWTEEERYTLAVLERFYDISRSSLAKIFNKLYSEILRDEGFAEGLTLGAIGSQIADLRHSPRGERFRDFIELNHQQASRTSRLLRKKIESIADSLNINLRPLSVNSSSTTRFRISIDSMSDSEYDTPTRSRRVAFDSSETSSLSESSPEESSDSDTSCSQSSWVDNTDESSLDEFGDDSLEGEDNRVGLKLKIRRDINNKKVHIRPRLLFRAFCPEHQVRARRFQTPSTLIPHPPAYGSTEFELGVLRHLSTDVSFESPWLSFTSSLDRALKIITNSQHILHLVVMDYNVVEESLRNRFGESDKLWLVPMICREAKDDKLRQLRKIDQDTSIRTRTAYTGRDEFLIWGSVPCPPVGVLNKEAVCRLVDATKRVAELSYNTGVYLGQFLQDIEDRYRGIVAYKLIRASKIKGYHRGHRFWAFEHFVNGIYDAEDSDDDPRWRGWSHATTPDIPFRLHPRPGRVIGESSPRRESTTIGSAQPANAPTPRRTENTGGDDAGIQEMVDEQLASEAAAYGILVVPEEAGAWPGNVDFG